jgi:hypothetical protein
MTNSQQHAINCFKGFMQQQLNKEARYGDALVEFTVEATAYGTFWLTARTDMVGLPSGNVLRYVSAQHWFVEVGKRGALTVRIAPKEFKQFNGRRAFGMTFNI